jgi:uncharacterized Zn finger protein
MKNRRRAAKGGIKAQSKRGTFGESWWAKRWLEVLNSYGLGARLTRGRSYARSGQVLSIDVGQGQVRARVQGSSPRPYSVKIEVKTLSAADWERVTSALAGQAIFAAKLLAGEMPQEIEQVFQEAGLSLFPAKMTDLTTECSCPDWSNPCKHTAAVYCLLGEEFDRDPFLLFALRGLSREELSARLAGAEVGGEQAALPELPPEPLAAEPSAFWSGVTLDEGLWGEVRKPPVSAALVRRLGKFPFWRGDEPLQDALEPDYDRASALGLNVFLGGAP